MSTTWNVPLYAQPDLNTCWRAAWRMMLAWYLNSHISDSEWERRCKSYLRGGYASSHPRLVGFQVDQAVKNIKPKLLSNQNNTLDKFLKHLAMGPVMFHLPGILFGHMVVAIGSSTVKRKSYLIEPIQPTSFKVADPCARGYPPGPCCAGTRIIPASKVESAIARGYIWYWK